MTTWYTNLSRDVNSSIAVAEALPSAFGEEIEAEGMEGEEEDGPAPELMEAVPVGAAAADVEELESAAVNHRVLILRGGAVVAVSTLLAVGGALFIHSVVAGLFVLAAYFGWTTATTRGTGVGGGNSIEEGGRGFVVLEGDPPAAVVDGTTAAKVLGNPDAGAVAPVLPALPGSGEQGGGVAAVVENRVEALPPAVNDPEDLGTVKVLPPVRAAAPVAAVISDPQVWVVPPGPVVRVAPPAKAVAAAGPRGNGGRAIGVPADDAFGDEPIVSLVKGDASGQGKGRGNGMGNGIDRGISAANRGAQPLSIPSPDFPMYFKRPAHDTKLSIEVLSDGRVGTVEVVESCGDPEIDEIVRQMALTKMKWSPAYRSGKPVVSTETFTQEF